MFENYEKMVYCTSLKIFSNSIFDGACWHRTLYYICFFWCEIDAVSLIFYLGGDTGLNLDFIMSTR